ncbi:glycosyltransferase family 32 protein [Rhizobium leguminosarum]|uniref:glycosyltransferase family 32 protein n=1 Tax=Rhizobium leguminosarum TaxID=384 RepID=UPI001FEDFCCA|nr:hypothetical protein [Rhizobium leguminosarum]
MDFQQRVFEEAEHARSAAIRELILKQELSAPAGSSLDDEDFIPRRLVRYWHDPADLPDDVLTCLDSWSRLADEGFEFCMFDDASAATYIAATYGDRELRAFTLCSHPAMRCDYLRMCFILAEGGLYVDADDVLVGDGWRGIFSDGRLKLQPLCYDITAGRMMPSVDVWRTDLPIAERNFYVNNDPIAAPARHPVLRRALDRATNKLLEAVGSPEIQATTGPGNLTVALVSHAWELNQAGLPLDFELLRNWDAIAEMKWDLYYRGDSRNWRNVYGC